jgi:hypothetical protein
MKLSENTINILKNFSAINPSILIRSGNTIRTIAMSGNIAAKAIVTESFDKEFAIYDLNQFLNGLRLYSEPELDFSSDSYVYICQGNHKIKYFLTDPALICAAEDREIRLPSQDVCFCIDETQFEKIIKASSIFSLGDLSIVGEDGVIKLKARKKENITSNEISIEVGTTTEEFCLNYKIENLKIIPGSYDVIISKELISKFVNKNFDLTYYIGLESDSTFY